MIPALENTLQLCVAQKSVAGRKAENEDAIGIRIPQGHAMATKGAVVVLADGVSAADAGKEASETAVTGFLSDYYSTPDTWSVQKSGLKVLIALNRWLYGRGQRAVQAEKGYVTTFSALVLKSHRAHLLHVGDSRIYRYRSNQLEQLTQDHSTPIEKGKRYLARALGIDLHLNIDYRKESLDDGDVFVLTTDGIHDFIDDATLKAHCEQLQSPDSDHLSSFCQRLIDEALTRGSDDNLSVQCIYIQSTGKQDSEEAIQQLVNVPFPPDLETGHRLDGWTVEKILQTSQRSQVYLVRNADGESAVMKTPSRNYADDAAYIERFAMEEWIGSRINSPHVVKTMVPTGARKFLYYLTEYVPGPTLAELLKQRGHLDIADAVSIITQVVSGIRAFHRKETLHQDIKPENIVYSPQGIKIIDFGSALVAGIDEIDMPLERERALGTLDYSAPEYHTGGIRNERSDQFAIAVLLYELLTGEHPYGGHYASANSPRKMQQLSYVPAARHNPLVPTWMDGAIEKALSIYPQNRYESLSEFVYDLKHPNQKFLTPAERPLLEKHPVKFWQVVSGVLALSQLVMLWLLFGPR